MKTNDFPLIRDTYNDDKINREKATTILTTSTGYILAFSRYFILLVFFVLFFSVTLPL